MIVLDASAALEWLVVSEAGQVIGARISAPGCSLHAPHLLDLEVAQALRRCDAAGTMTERQARAALADLADIGVQRYPHDPLLPRVWQLRHNLTAYDAVYVALAEILRAPLVTCDARLARVPGHRARVDLVPR